MAPNTKYWVVLISTATTARGGTTDPDYSGVPATLTFASGETEKVFTFTAAQDEVDDDGEYVDLSFGSPCPRG